MSLTDPIADMLTRIRNAQAAEHEMVRMPHSKLKGEIARLLKKEGFITDYVVEGGDAKKELRLYLKYVNERDPVIHGIERESRPGLRVHVAADEVPRVLAGMGVAILSTSSGVMTDKEARERGVGGEVLCKVW